MPDSFFEAEPGRPAGFLAYEGPVLREVEGGAGGFAGVVGVGVGAVGGVLEGGAEGVDAFEEGVAGDALGGGEFVGVGLGVLGGAVVREVALDEQDLGGVDAGEVVGSGEGDEGVGVLEEGGAVGVEALADQIGAGVEIGGGVAIGLEEFFLLLGRALDAVEFGDEEALRAFRTEGGGFALAAGLAGGGGLRAGLGDEGAEGGVVGGGETAFFEVGGVAGRGGENLEVFTFLDVIELGLVEKAGRLLVGVGCIEWIGGWGGNWL